MRLPTLTLNQKFEISFNKNFAVFRYDKGDEILLQCENGQNFSRNLSISNSAKKKVSFKLKPNSTETINLRDYFSHFEPFLDFTIGVTSTTRVRFSLSSCVLQINSGRYKPFIVDFNEPQIKNAWFNAKEPITLTCFNETLLDTIVIFNDILYGVIPSASIVNFDLKNLIINKEGGSSSSSIIPLEICLKNPNDDDENNIMHSKFNFYNLQKNLVYSIGRRDPIREDCQFRLEKF